MSTTSAHVEFGNFESGFGGLEDSGGLKLITTNSSPEVFTSSTNLRTRHGARRLTHGPQWRTISHSFEAAGGLLDHSPAHAPFSSAITSSQLRINPFRSVVSESLL